VTPGRRPPGAPATCCPDCLSWGSSCGLRSYCRACYDFTSRYHQGECGGCRRIIAIKKGHCRLCWLQAGIAASGRRRITPADFTPGGSWQLSLAGMSRLGSTGPAQAPPAGPAPPAAASGWTQLQLSAPGESLHFDKRHWARQRELGNQHIPRPHRHPRAPPRRPATRGSPHLRPRPAAPRRRIRARRHHRHPLRHHRTPAAGNPAEQHRPASSRERSLRRRPEQPKRGRSRIGCQAPRRAARDQRPHSPHRPR
jgi:hypothetical protein